MDKNTYFGGQRCLPQAAEGVCVVLSTTLSSLACYGLYPLRPSLKPGLLEILATLSGGVVDSMERLCIVSELF